MKLLVTFWLGYVVGWGPYGTPPITSNLEIFHIARSKDAKTIHYQLQLTEEGSINTAAPLKIFLEIETKSGFKTENLTWIQNKYAYGVEILNVNQDSLSFQFVSYDKKTIRVKRNSKGEFEAQITCNNTDLILEKIFIQIDGGTFWVPTISSVKLEGKDLHTGRSKFEIIQP